MTLFIILAAVSLALILGACLGLYGPFPNRVDAFLVAVAGGALIVSAMSELITPAVELLPLWGVVACVAGGAVFFSVADNWLEQRFEDDEGMGLLLSITADGVPENLALGVALISAGGLEVAALAGAIVLSNFPEAAGGARRMAKDMDRRKVLAIWTGVAALLMASAVLGNFALRSAPDAVLSAIKCFAAGAIVASLAMEVLPKANAENHRVAGVAIATGLIVALVLNQLSG